ncbi:class I SAM-dependent methyltransferase [Gynuella sunshinyii]|uniref:Ribosomal protein L11 methylase n=1 Tax=Gynuella sunshinyii YC6258 TaxID=1445510 RepID=A0A0C5VQR6_9GAMM|nr:class I SAM-dependent methyltransferase [Gynuella sunshinyii]AJQ92609.1 ribosomal protein L11 methylase [Gynuella sunshinyii YC6258]
MPQYIKAPEKHIYRAYDIWLLQNKHRFVKQLQKFAQPDTHGDKTWDSSFLIMDYVTHHRPKKGRVLDVGCGWGPTAIYMAKQGHKVTGLDLDENVFPYLRVQAELNDVSIKEHLGAMNDIDDKKLSRFDIITGADICFWESLRDEWWKFINRAAKAGVKQVILADPGRSPFLELVEKCEKKFNTDYYHWYATEPKHFDGFLMIVNLV